MVDLDGKFRTLELSVQDARLVESRALKAWVAVLFFAEPGDDLTEARRKLASQRKLAREIEQRAWRKFAAS